MPKKKARRPMRRSPNVPKTCYFCDGKITPSFADVENLGKFTTERGKILSRSKSGICAKHQKDLTEAIKQARHLALMPFMVRI